MPYGDRDFPKAYNPKQVEERIYQHWLEGGYFIPKTDPAMKPFVIIMPPPNMTGDLHYGHALTATLEDIMTRWHRMRGEPALWLPGVDHAGIAAQVVVERQLASEGMSRHALGREKFLERMWGWVEKCRINVRNQHQRIGASCDWTRERFTLDEGPVRAVRTAFVRLYQKGLIYRGERIINWCPRCGTALSDLEVEHEEVTGHLYYIKYPLADEASFVSVATTRPETILGDTAVAVNPADIRYSALVGRKLILPALGRVIPIVADDAVDPAFGTGAVKVTPAHDPVDFEIAQRHGLPMVNILNPDATMNENAGLYRGLERFDCRRRLLADLEKDSQMVKVEPHQHSVGHCHRCHTMVEPWASKQWFVKAKPLAEPALRAVLDGRIKIIPEQFAKSYSHWMENIRDWCISRQLWWGHRIPVWHCEQCTELTVAVDTPERCTHCGSSRIHQDPDVLDTWFSSGLWPHSTLGWPEDTPDFGYFYPTSVMETAYDILFFWVARMIMMGLEDTGEVPFRTVYLHGLVRDEKGEKMSKLKGNVLDPLDAVERYGADALRFALTTGCAPGTDMRVSPEKLEWGRNFANKLWNAARFVIQSSADVGVGLGEIGCLLESSRPVEDRWILSRLNQTIVKVNQLLEDFQFGEAERQIYDFVWGEFCDWYIELAKTRLSSAGRGEPTRRDLPSPAPVLLYVLETSLRLLHPFMPFVTEELWQKLPRLAGWREGDYCWPCKHAFECHTTGFALFPKWLEGEQDQSLMVALYPSYTRETRDPEAEREVGLIIEAVSAIRNARVEHRIEAARWIELQIYTEHKPLFESFLQPIGVLARARPVVVRDRGEPRPTGGKSIAVVLPEADLVMPMAETVDIESQRRRLDKEIEACEEEVQRVEKRLQDSVFLDRAPEWVVDKERGKHSRALARLSKLRERLSELP